MSRHLLIFLLAGVQALAVTPDAARIAARYKQMLAANPSEGVALDRLWKMAQENGTTGALIDEYKSATGTFSGAMIYGHLLRRAGETDEARAAFEVAAKVDAASPLPHFALAQLFNERNTPRAAAEELEKGAALLPQNDPKLADVLLQIANAWLAANEMQRAVDVLERTCALNPGDLSLRRRLADVYEKNGLSEKAAPHWEFIAAHAEPAMRAQALQNLARIRQAGGNVDAAIAALNDALALTAPGNWLRAQLQSELIKIHERYHRLPELEARWKKEAEENPRDAGAILQLVDFYERALDAQQERDWLEKLCALLPKNIDYKTKLARVCAEIGDLDRAASLLDEALAAQPNNADLVLDRAELDVRRNAIQAARDRVEALLQRTPDDETLTARVVDWYEKNRITDAVEQHLKQSASRDENAQLALVNWYFAQSRNDDARRALHQLVREDCPPEKQAAALAKTADILREHNDAAGALDALRRAVKLQPKSAEYRLALAEMLLGASRYDEAQSETQQAFALSESEKDREAADEKLFQIFQSRVAKNEALPPQTSRSGVTLLPPPGIGITRPNELLEKFVADLAREANAHPGAAAFLRLARWQSRARKYHEALESAKRAISLDPKSTEARELAVKVAIGNGQQLAAMDFLRELAQLDPSRKAAAMRQIGEIEMESGHTDQALQIFNDLEKANPGSIETLSDLALAQQQANRWPEALAIWRRAFEASPATKKKEIAQPLLRAMERLSMFQPAAELLLHSLDVQQDENARIALLTDLIAFCKRHGLSAWLQQQFDRRHKARPDDYFAAIADAKILKENGFAHESLTVLADAAYSSHDQAGPLQELVREAEELGDVATAIQFQRRLVALAAQSNLQAREKLASLLEANLDIAAATTTWNQLVQLFPRDASLLDRAADFFLRWAAFDRSREILRGIRSLEPRNAEALTKLVKLAKRAGDKSEALSCCEQILQNTQPSRDAMRFPGVPIEQSNHRVQRAYFAALRMRGAQPDPAIVDALSTFWSGDTAVTHNETDLRFAAIREISQLVAADGNNAALHAWLARWDHAESPAEALWAFFYAGAFDRAAAQLETLAKGAPDDLKMRQAFIWLALQMGQVDLLRGWLKAHAQDSADRDLLLVALSEFAKNENTLDAEVVTNLFAGESMSRSMLWQAAVQFASRNRFADAIRLGERVFNATPVLRASYAVEIAHWYLYLGDRESALRMLRQVINETADSLDQPVYQAIREYFLLLPEAERASFAERFEQGIDRARAPLHAALAMALVRGLQGDEQGAKTELSRLLNLRAVGYKPLDESGDSAYRFWSFVLTTGMQLQAWHMDSLAENLWEQSLADPAAIRLQGDQAVLISRDIKLRALAGKMTHAIGSEAQILIDDFLKTTPPENVQGLASVLENNGAYPQAVAIWRTLWRRDPGNVQLLHNVLNTCRTANDSDTMAAVVTEALQHPSRDVVMKLTELAESAMNLDEVDKTLGAMLRLHPGDVQLLDRLARVQERRGRLDEAAQTYRQLLMVEPNNIARRIALADLLERAHKTNEAITMLEVVKNSPEVDLPLALLYFKAGRIESARTQSQKISQGNNASAVVQIAENFANSGQVRDGLVLLQSAANKTKDVHAQFSLQSKFVELAAEKFPGLAKPALWRLRETAAATPEMFGTFLQLQNRVAQQLGIDLEKALTDQWHNGDDAPAAAAKLVELYAQTKQEKKLATLVTQIKARSDFDEPILWQVTAVLQNEQRELASDLFALILQRNPANENAACSYIRALHELGRDADAYVQLQKFACRWPISDSVAGEAAPLFIQLGDPASALAMFENAVRSDPMVRTPAVYMSYARFLRDYGDARNVLNILRQAFRNPANRDVAQIVDFYAATQRLDRLEHELPSFSLSPENARALHVELFEYFEKEQRFSDALNVLQSHPEIVKIDVLRARLRPFAAKANAYDAVAGTLETFISQNYAPEIARELALLNLDWSQNETSSDSALVHLQRANELAPDHFEIAQKLCNLFLEKKQRDNAIRVLNRFLQVSHDDGDKLKAQQLLARIQSA